MRDGQPPTPVYLDAKHGSDLFGEPGIPFLRDPQLDKFRAEVERQIDAMPEGSVLEWHFSDPDAARQVGERFGDWDMSVEFIFTPVIGREGGAK